MGFFLFNAVTTNRRILIFVKLILIMKKFLLPATVLGFSLILSSCSPTDENPENPNAGTEPQMLLSKITTVYYDSPSNPETTVSTLEYNSQRQVTKILSEGRSSTYEYDASGRPVKTNYYKPDGSLEYYNTYTYNGDQLEKTMATYSNPDYNRTITYMYNNGKVISSTLLQPASNPITDSYTYIGENISSEIHESSGGIIPAIKREYSYDNKSNPFTNSNKHLKTMMGGAYTLSPNNYTTEKISYKTNSGSWTESQVNTYEIQYNSAQLPTQVTGKDANGNNTVKYNYEYISL